MGTSWVAVSINNITTRASREMTSGKKYQHFRFKWAERCQALTCGGRGICHLWLPCCMMLCFWIIDICRRNYHLWTSIVHRLLHIRFIVIYHHISCNRSTTSGQTHTQILTIPSRGPHRPWSRYGKGQPIWEFYATYFFKHLGVSKTWIKILDDCNLTPEVVMGV